MSLGSKRLESLDVLRGFDMFFILLPDPVPCIVVTFLAMFGLEQLGLSFEKSCNFAFDVLE